MIKKLSFFISIILFGSAFGQKDKEQLQKQNADLKKQISSLNATLNQTKQESKLSISKPPLSGSLKNSANVCSLYSLSDKFDSILFKVLNAFSHRILSVIFKPPIMVSPFWFCAKSSNFLMYPAMTKIETKIQVMVKIGVCVDLPFIIDTVSIQNVTTETAYSVASRNDSHS